MREKWLLLGLGVSACLLAAGCRPCPQALARRQLERELARRQARRSRSAGYCDQAIAHYRSGDLAKADEALTKAIQADPTNAAAWTARGIVRARSDRPLEALQAFERASRLAPLRHEPLFNMGTVFESLGRYEQAVRSYEQALELNGGDLQTMENLARCYIRLNTRLEKASELLDRALAMETRPQWRMWLEDQAAMLARKGLKNESAN